MKYHVFPAENGVQKVSVELDASEVSRFLEGFYPTLALRAGIKPEAGLTSREVVERNVAQDVIGQSASEYVVMKAAPIVMEEAGIEYVGTPDFGCHGFANPGESYSFDIVAVLIPVVGLNSFAPVSLPRQEGSVTDEDVDAFVARVAAYHPDYMVDDEADSVQADSCIRLAMSAMCEGEPYEPLCFEEREYLLGQGDMPDGFDEGIIGMGVGDQRCVAFSAEGVVRDSEGKLPVREYEATVRVIAVLKQVRPAIDDAWVAANVAGVSTLDQFREKARAELEAERCSREHAYRRYAAADQISRRLTAPIPDEAFLAHYSELMQSLMNELYLQGVSEEEYCNGQGLSPEDLSRRIMSQAREQLRQACALDAVAKQQRIVVTDDDVCAYLQDNRSEFGDVSIKDVRKSGALARLRRDILRMKANEWLVETAEVA